MMTFEVFFSKIVEGEKMKNIYGETIQDLEKYFESIGEKKYKAVQVYEWLYQKRVTDFSQFTNLKGETIERLKADYSLNRITIKKREIDELTEKYLFQLEDNECIEAVLMYHDYGISVCVSSEVGCNMGCAFCESGRRKKVRNLWPHEIVLQILAIEQTINRRISSVVIMGIGEPLDNYDNIIKFINIINHPKGIALGARHITLSTCGLIPKIKELSKLNIQINLAVSLHAPSDELRDKLMPVNKVYSITPLITTLKEYIEITNRRVTIEYVMLNMVNDTPECAKMLANLLKGLNVYVNLIPYNETSHLHFKKSSKERILKFYDVLKKEGINVTIRKEFGSKISAACGQLRSKEVQ